MRPTFLTGVVMVGLLAGCGTSAPAVPPQASTSSEPSASAPPSASSAPTSSVVATVSPTSGSAGSFTVCPTQVDRPVCPLPPGDYVAAVHDRFSFTISEVGWQEEPQQAAEFATRIALSRVDDPDLRVTFLSGSTGPTSPVDLGAAVVAPPGFTASQPVDVTISSTQAQYVDLLSGGAQAAATLNIEGVGVSVEPDKSYRLTFAKIPMDQEAASLLIVTEAPADRFATFVTTADAVVKSVTF